MAESEFEERGRLIEQMLDQVSPFLENGSEELREAIDNERQMLAIRFKWGTMPIEQLRRAAARGH